MLTKNNPPANAPVLKKHGFLFELNRNKILFLMILPVILYSIIFSYVPMVGNIVAFKNFRYNQGIFGSPWVGFKNFRFLIRGGVLWRITRNTILYNLVFMVLNVVFQVGVALMLNEIISKRLKKLCQSMMFLPYFISYVLVKSIAYAFFNSQYGAVNNLLTGLGLETVNFYSDAGVWPYLLVFFHLWKGTGYGVVVYMAAITGISSEYYEAATLDGANKLQQIRYITLPMLKPTVITLTLFAVGNIMKGQFELFYQLIGNNGLLFKTTDIIDTYVFRTITDTFDPGTSAATGLYQSVFGFILIMTVNTIVKKVEPRYALF